MAAVLFAAILPLCHASALPRVECAGDAKASHAILYLHGVDSPDPSEQEVGNRQLLIKLAKSEGVALALMRSHEPCAQPAYKGKLCWPQKNHETLDQQIAALLSDSLRCRKADAVLGAIGFSNGGYFLNKSFTQCITPKISWYLSIGSAGSLEGTKPAPHCGKLHLMIGRKDITNQAARQFYQDLKKSGFASEFSEFEGGHVLSEEPLRKAFRSFKLIRKKKP